MRQSEKEWGLVAILDALGAASYSDEEIARFIRSREIVLSLLNEKAEAVAIPQAKLTTFTFNDTVVIVHRTGRETTLDEVAGFFTLLRKFVVDSLKNRILFRGSIAIGSFYANDDTNTVMGQAVSDAAAWYDSADWIGIHATPHASLFIEALIAAEERNLDRLITDYPIPFRDGSTQNLKAVNWPKAFFVAGLTPCRDGQDERARCLELLSKHRVPKGTERKYLNALEFFDYISKKQSKQSAAAAQKSKKAKHT